MASALAFLRLTLLYTAALILIAAAIKLDRDPAGSAQINFAYKVF